MRRVSVIIANYDYGGFVGEAIDSALALDWPDVEVVVVDDGSTDDSASVINAYADRVTGIFTANRGQREACNTGFAASTGDAVVFLDADDVLPRDFLTSAAAVWTARTSKVQFQMQRVTATGEPIGTPFPAWSPVPTPQQLHRWMTTTSAYPTPPGSGNLYSRWFLERVLPAGPELGTASDSAPIAAAPLLGDVASVTGVPVGYRQHGANDSGLLADPRRFAREIQVARARWRYATSLAGGPQRDERPLFRSRELLQFRVAATRSYPQAARLPGDGRARQALDALRAPAWPGPEPLGKRLAISAWCLAVALAPLPVINRLLRFRYQR